MAGTASPVANAPELVAVTHTSTVSSGSAYPSLLPVTSSMRTESVVMFG